MVIPGEAPRKVSKIRRERSCLTSKGQSIVSHVMCYFLKISASQKDIEQVPINLPCGSLYQVVQPIGKHKTPDSVKATWSQCLRYQCFFFIFAVVFVCLYGCRLLLLLKDTRCQIQSKQPGHSASGINVVVVVLQFCCFCCFRLLL